MSKIHSRIKIPVALASKGGALEEFVWNNMIRGYKLTFSSEEITLNGTDPNEQPSFADLVAIVVGGGSFTGIKLALRFDNVAAAQQDVPAEIRGATYTDEEGVEQSRNWIDWLKVNSSTQIITDGVSYAIKAMFNGQLFDSAELTLAHTQAGITVIEWADATELFANEDWTIFEL